MKLTSIQALRAVAALLVLFAHLWTPFTQFNAGDKFPNFIQGAAGVDLFFVISGFIMAYSSERFFAQPLGAARFMLRRLVRIVPLYWATTTFFLMMIQMIGQTLATMDATPKLVVASYFFVPMARPSGGMVPLHGVGWTLEYEMFFYCLFALCIVLHRRTAILTACAALVGLTLLPNFVIFPMPLSYLVTPFLWEFVFGLLIALAYRSGWRIPRFSAVCMGGVGLLTFLWSCTQDITSGSFVAEYRFTLWGGSAALILAACVLSPFQVRGRWLSPLVLIGEASYALYLTHTITLHIVWLSVAKRLPASHPYVFAALMWTCAIGVALIVYRCFERPITEHLNAYFERRLDVHSSTSTVSAAKSLP